MNEKKIREEIYEKLEEEYNQFLKQVELKSPKEIVESAYEIAAKKEIKETFSPYSEYYDVKLIQLLQKIQNPLDCLYQDWIKYNDGITEEIKECVDETLFILNDKQNQKKNEKER